MEAPVRSPQMREVIFGGILLMLCAAVIWRFGSFLKLLRRLLHTVRPLLLGVLFAVMLNPSYQRLYADFAAFAEKKGGSPQAHRIKTFSLFGAVLPPLTVLFGVICVLIPQVMQSVRMISENLSSYSENLTLWLERVSQTKFGQIFSELHPEALLSRLQEQLPALIVKTYDYTTAFFGVLADIGIGAVFALYLLADKQRICKQIRAICSGLMPERYYHAFAAGLRTVCGSFARFLSSQCKESLILGLLCWAGMVIFRFPYPVLVSVVIGVTNIVPYFGPLFGTIPCALLLLLVKPRVVIWFIVFIIILQQLESNLIYPRVVGQSVGLPPAWVLAAIVIGGGLFGVTGMIVAVPIAAAGYTVLFGETR